MTFRWADAGLAKPARVLDCWRARDVPAAGDGCALDVPPRFVEVLRLYPGGQPCGKLARNSKR